MPGRLEEEISSTCIMCMLVCVPLLWKHQDLTPGRYTFLGPCSLAWHRETLTGPYDSKSLDMLSTSGVFLSSSSLRACAVVRDGLQRVHSCWYRLRVYMYYRVPTLLLLVKQRKRCLLTSNARIPRSLRTYLAPVGILSPDRINLMGACV